MINTVSRRERADFHSMPKQHWNEEVVRIVRASKLAQQRMAEWSPELTRNHSPS